MRHLNASGGPDANQVLAYDLAHAASAAATARAMLDYGAKGDVEARHRLCLRRRHGPRPRHPPRRPGGGLGRRGRADLAPAADVPRRPTATRTFIAALAETPGARHLDDDMELVQDTFRAFATNVVAPQAEHVHRTNGDVPEDVIAGLAEIGAFGLSVPAEYGGYSEGGDGEYLAMVVATEELSRASLGIGGSLITRPEILTRALVKGGTEEQKQ